MLGATVSSQFECLGRRLVVGGDETLRQRGAVLDPGQFELFQIPQVLMGVDDRHWCGLGGGGDGGESDGGGTTEKNATVHGIPRESANRLRQRSGLVSGRV